MNVIMLREATKAGTAALASLHVASWQETYTAILPDEITAGLSVERQAAMWSKILGDPGAFGCASVVLASAGDDIVGFGSCGEQRDQALADAGFGGEFSAIYVLRSHQSRGIGRAIMTRMRTALFRVGHTAASLWVLRDNASARTFYERLGGEIIGEKAREESGAALVEVAYGWRDLSRFAACT